MKEQLKPVSQAFEGTSDGLDGIIEALRGHLPPEPPPPPNPKTVITYYNVDPSTGGHTDIITQEFEIIGEIGHLILEDLIPGSNHRIIKIEIGNLVTKIQNSSFEDYGISSIIIPSSVLEIGNNAFYYCSNLSSITIPSGVTSIGRETFRYCSNLSSLTFLSKIAPTLGFSVFGLFEGYEFTGWNTHLTGNNVLKIPQEAIGYDSGQWADPLQNNEKCGFHIEYIQ